MTEPIQFPCLPLILPDAQSFECLSLVSSAPSSPSVPKSFLQWDTTVALGAGACGEVYHGTLDAFPVAVKVLRGSAVRRGSERAFQRELRRYAAMSKVTGVVHTYGAGWFEDTNRDAIAHSNIDFTAMDDNIPINARRGPYMQSVALRTDARSETCTDRANVFAMELMRGGTLLDVIDRHIAKDASMSIADRLEIAASIADALSSIHAAGFTHGDVKPGNIVLSHSLDFSKVDSNDFDTALPHGLQVKFVDLGSSRDFRIKTFMPSSSSASSSSLSPSLLSSPPPTPAPLPTTPASPLSTGSPRSSQSDPMRAAAYSTRNNYGTPAYIAPEAWKGQAALCNAAIALAADVYSLGMTLYQLATGERPWRHKSEWQIFCAVVKQNERPKWPEGRECVPGFQALVRSCWDADYNSRPSALIVACCLRQLLQAHRTTMRRNFQASLTANPMPRCHIQTLPQVHSPNQNSCTTTDTPFTCPKGRDLCTAICNKNNKSRCDTHTHSAGEHSQHQICILEQQGRCPLQQHQQRETDTFAKARDISECSFPRDSVVTKSHSAQESDKQAFWSSPNFPVSSSQETRLASTLSLSPDMPAKFFSRRSGIAPRQQPQLARRPNQDTEQAQRKIIPKQHKQQLQTKQPTQQLQNSGAEKVPASSVIVKCPAGAGVLSAPNGGFKDFCVPSDVDSSSDEEDTTAVHQSPNTVTQVTRTSQDTIPIPQASLVKATKPVEQYTESAPPPPPLHVKHLDTGLSSQDSDSHVENDNAEPHHPIPRSAGRKRLSRLHLKSVVTKSDSAKSGTNPQQSSTSHLFDDLADDHVPYFEDRSATNSLGSTSQHSSGCRSLGANAVPVSERILQYDKLAFEERDLTGTQSLAEQFSVTPSQVVAPHVHDAPNVEMSVATAPTNVSVIQNGDPTNTAVAENEDCKLNRQNTAVSEAGASSQTTSSSPLTSPSAFQVTSKEVGVGSLSRDIPRPCHAQPTLSESATAAVATSDSVSSAYASSSYASSSDKSPSACPAVCSSAVSGNILSNSATSDGRPLPVQPDNSFTASTSPSAIYSSSSPVVSATGFAPTSTPAPISTSSADAVPSRTRDGSVLVASADSSQALHVSYPVNNFRLSQRPVAISSESTSTAIRPESRVSVAERGSVSRPIDMDVRRLDSRRTESRVGVGSEREVSRKAVASSNLTASVDTRPSYAEEAILKLQSEMYRSSSPGPTSTPVYNQTALSNQFQEHVRADDYESILDAMANAPSSASVCRDAMAAIAILLSNFDKTGKDIRTSFAFGRGIELLLNAVSRHGNRDTLLCAHFGICVQCIAECVSDDVDRELRSSDASASILQCMRWHPSSRTVIFACLHALDALTRQSSAMRNLLVQKNIVTQLKRTVIRFMNKSDDDFAIEMMSLSTMASVAATDAQALVRDDTLHIILKFCNSCKSEDVDVEVIKILHLVTQSEDGRNRILDHNVSRGDDGFALDMLAKIIYRCHRYPISLRKACEIVSELTCAPRKSALEAFNSCYMIIDALIEALLAADAIQDRKVSKELTSDALQALLKMAVLSYDICGAMINKHCGQAAHYALRKYPDSRDVVIRVAMLVETLAKSPCWQADAIVPIAEEFSVLLAKWQQSPEVHGPLRRAYAVMDRRLKACNITPTANVRSAGAAENEATRAMGRSQPLASNPSANIKGKATAKAAPGFDNRRSSLPSSLSPCDGKPNNQNPRRGSVATGASEDEKSKSNPSWLKSLLQGKK